MKAAAFAYARATSVANALDLRRPLAPQAIVDIGELTELGETAFKGETHVTGVLTRGADLLKSSDIVKRAPLRGAAGAHPAIRRTPDLILTALGQT
jgi:carbon-monoxide dehydrogenase medium subunit